MANNKQHSAQTLLKNNVIVWSPAGMQSRPRRATPATQYVSTKYTGTKEKKMGWFRKKFMEWSRRAWEDSEVESVGPTSAYDQISGNSSIRFTIYPASGGHIIEHHRQDRYRDSSGPNLTIVSAGDDLGKAVEHIIAIEALRT